MRRGQNPAKFIREVSQPKPVTVAVITFIPFLEGYYQQSLEVLKVCLGSVLAHTDQPYDLMVFDNASCPQVVHYLLQLKQKGNIQYLLLSEKNVGKMGALNSIFGAAPGEYVAYADSDVYYYPGWLPKHLAVFDAFPEAGTVAGIPRKGKRKFAAQTIAKMATLPNATFEKGHFVPEDWILDHARSLAKMDLVREDLKEQDYRVTRNGVSAYATATHFQFMVRTRVVRPFLPFPYDRPMGDSVANFDRAIDQTGLLRLAVDERTVRHLGNTLDEQVLTEIPDYLREAANLTDLSGLQAGRSRLRAPIYDWKPLKRLLLGLHNKIFQIYYGRKV